MLKHHSLRPSLTQIEREEVSILFFITYSCWSPSSFSGDFLEINFVIGSLETLLISRKECIVYFSELCISVVVEEIFWEAAFSFTNLHSEVI